MQATFGPRAVVAIVLALICASASEPAAQQTATVQGTITEAGTARPLVNAQVTIRGTGIGTLTNSQGRFQLVNVPSGQATLRVELMGYEAATQTITVRAGEATTVNLTLAQSAIAIEGLVVTAMGITQRERAIATSVQTVNAEELAQASEPNLVAALAGRSAGVEVRSTGTQGGSSRVVIRGASSISGNNQPLFVVDGVPIDNSAPRLLGFAGSTAEGTAGSVDYGNAVADINPNDIETITVLKGPNAAALYGSRAANGAIVITTKSGVPPSADPAG
jgi:TonB-dependent SusC/RagA subfamily outer membrane receptor